MQNRHTSNVVNIPTQVKNRNLVEMRRRQIIDAAVTLFIEKRVSQNNHPPNCTCIRPFHRFLV